MPVRLLAYPLRVLLALTVFVLQSISDAWGFVSGYLYGSSKVGEIRFS